MAGSASTPSRSLSDLPVDELAAYARELGLTAPPDTPRGELLRLIRERQELLLELDRNALLDIAAWGRVPVRRSEGKEALASRISKVCSGRYEGLSQRGLIALARLRGVETVDGEPRRQLEKRLRRKEGWWPKLRRARRAVAAGVVTSLVSAAEEGEYHFLPEQPGEGTLKESIEESGVVGGIAHKLRGVADHYVEAKLDEIERRIDRKLDEIDRRLGEWRDREIVHRLRLVKVTLITAVIVAAASLLYDYLKTRVRDSSSPPAAAAPLDPQVIP